MTGLAIVIYLNQTPYQPRERDYAYAGSFYAFAIWIGLGVAAIYKLLSKNKSYTIGGNSCRHIAYRSHTDGESDVGRSRPFG